MGGLLATEFAQQGGAAAEAQFPIFLRQSFRDCTGYRVLLLGMYGFLFHFHGMVEQNKATKIEIVSTLAKVRKMQTCILLIIYESEQDVEDMEIGLRKCCATSSYISFSTCTLATFDDIFSGKRKSDMGKAYDDT
ncbi:hypothetical protein RHSIM_Rhsim03G0076600 [Rhododendron simsii]|uniref:Uncharacterized protein n=1 Tax=Rhododendron simsii TaxID=118357 RepID=A0A834H486_RHOSS|nr:hypothetical protein RHSIM_Rhsim03G0076600 [Rhododendron simsii]